MVCLLPQFKCSPDTLSTHYRTHTNSLKVREPVCSRARCILTMPTTMTTTMETTTTVVDVEKLGLPSLEAHTNSVTADRPLSYIGPIGSPTKPNFEATLATEALLPSEEAVISTAAAAAEAVALAKAAFEAAQDLTLMEQVRTIHHHPVGTKTKQDEEHSIQFSQKDSENLIPTDDELKLQEMQLYTSIDVRSGRQTERRARRARAAKKSAANVVFGNPRTSRRKKRVALHEVDYSDPLRYLRGTTSTSRLLTATEELEFSEGIQKLLKLENLHRELAERCGVQPTFVQWAEAAGVDQKTLRKRINYGVLCKEKMVKSNIRLVISIAKNYQGAGMNLQDLVQEGCRGLVKGAEKFDASKGFRFSTYAHWWIKQAVQKSLSEQSRTIRLPSHMVEATYRVREARKQLYCENGRHPNNEEIAEATGLSMKRLTAVLLTPRPPRSLDQKIGINQNLKPLEVITYPGAETTEDLLNKQFMQQDLERVLDSLNSRENQVIRWRFGLKDGRMRTLQEIGELMGVSRERIRQIETCAFRKLKNKKRTKILQQYLVSL